MNQRLLRILSDKTEHYPYALESRFPRILDTIMSLWDDDTIDDYFMSLLVNDREFRVGFPPEIASEIMHLSLIHAAQEKHEKHSNKDIWDVPSDSFIDFAPHADTQWIVPPQSTKADLMQYDLPCSPAGFFEAVETGNPHAVALFLQIPGNIDIRDERGWTPLMMAAFKGHDELLDLLLQHGAEVNALDTSDNSALHWAAFGGHAYCLKTLIEQHARIDCGNNFGWTPLMQATVRDHPEIATRLIKKGADVNKSATDGYTPLHKAASSGYPELVSILLGMGADRTLKTRSGDTPMKLAIKNKNQEIIDLLSH